MSASFFSINTSILAYALAGGILPALFWLWFWLREDSLHPEPKKILFWCFLAGGLTTIAAIALESYVARIATGAPMLFAWAFIEESLKLIVVYFVAFRGKDFDEPTDALIYLITVALGFAAIENTLFIIKAIKLHGETTGLLIGNIRFVGATLVHVVSSSAVGATLAIAFYKAPRIKIEAAATGLILATGLHGLFNFFIIQGEGRLLWPLLAVVWICILMLILFFERVKTITS